MIRKLFYYYGRKKKLAKKYPVAKYNTIIEPFAGASAYSLLPENISKEVILIEKNKRVYDLWKWLIEEATVEDLNNIGYIKKGDKTDNFFIILHSASKRAFDYKQMTITKVMETNWNCNLPKMIELLPKIKHWQIYNDSFESADEIIGNREATWFIDPPYQGEAGTGYENGSNDIDYTYLSNWCKERNGQVIVCEGGEANWLPFEALTTQSTINGKKNNELIWTMNKNSLL